MKALLTFYVPFSVLTASMFSVNKKVKSYVKRSRNLRRACRTLSKKVGLKWALINLEDFSFTLGVT